MCLLIALHRTHPAAPLVVAANRDEMLSRPAAAMGVLQDAGPRVLGGRDLAAGGTWLAVNEHGVIAGLTNRPQPQRDPSKRSRGEWPVFLARHWSAREAVERFLDRFDPVDYHGAWVLAGDARDLFYVEMSPDQAPVVEQLEAGVHVLENRSLGASSPKVALVKSELAGIDELELSNARDRLRQVLASHQIPGTAAERPDPDYPWKPAAALAPCVHANGYGTRCSTIATVSSTAGEAPRLWHADGPPCTSPLTERTGLWTADLSAPVGSHD